MIALKQSLNWFFRSLVFITIMLLAYVSIVGSGSSSSSSPPPTPTLTSISVTPTSLTDDLQIALAQQFTATGTYSDNSTQDITSSVTWDSSNTSAATINASGQLTGVAVGTTNVTAALSGKTSNIVSVNVIAPTLLSISVSPSSLPNNLPIDVTQQFAATASYSNNTKTDVTKTVAWNSSTTGTATIDANGLAIGVAAGNTNITAALSGLTSNTVAVTVVNPNLLSLSVTPTTVPNKLSAGRTQSFKAEGVFDNNKTYDVTNFVTWNSSNLAAATIDNSGVATGVAAGTTNITASTTTPAVTSNIVALEVTVPTATAVIIEPQTFDPLPVNRKQLFKAYLKFDNDTLTDVTKTSAWSSADTNIATVNNNPSVGPVGMVVGVSPGTVNITASDNDTGLMKSVSVTVNNATITAVNVVPSNPNALPAGFTQEFTATGTFTDGKTRALTEPLSWAVSNSTIATFENPGKSVTVQGLVPGTVNINYIDLLADGKESGQTGTSELTVTDAILQSIALNPGANFSIPAGGQTFFTAIGSYSDSSGRDITSEVIWESADTTVVVFGPEGGKMTALASGAGNNANVLAKAQNTANPPVVISSPVVNVSVLAATLDSLTIQPQLDPEQVGFTRQFHVTGTYSTGNQSSFTQRVTWSTSDTAIATVSNDVDTKGQVTGVAPGITTLTATDPETNITTNLNITVSQP